MDAGLRCRSRLRVSERQQARAGVAGEEWPKPLPVVLAPAPDEVLSSWVERHAVFCGLGPTAMRRHCAPDAPSLRALDRALTSEQEERLSRVFRLGPSTLRQMTHEELGSEAIGLLVARDIDHWCKRCARSLAEAGFPDAIPRAWFHTWRITCPRCDERVSPARSAAGAGALPDLFPDLFPDLWAEALAGERLIDAVLHHQTTAPVLPIPAMRLLRLLMIWTGSEQVLAKGKRQRDGWTLNAVVPGFDATLERHGIEIPRTTLINVPLPVRTALLAGLALTAQHSAPAIQAMWATTTGMHRAHFRYVLTDTPDGHRFRPLIAA